MKKSQIQATPLLYVFALVVGAIILVFGISQIYNLMTSVEQIELGTFKKNLEREVRSVYNLDFGSAVESSFSIPSEIIFVCFTDGRGGLDESNERLEDLIFLKPSDNVFILGEEFEQDLSFRIENFESYKNPLCFRTTGKLNLVLENRGTHVSPIE